MEDFSKKFRLIFIPYLVLLVLTTAGYSFFTWYIYLHKAVPQSWDYVILAMPVVVCIIVVLIWLRPRFRLLMKKNKQPKDLPQFELNQCAILAMAVPMVFFQHFIIGATGKLTKVKTPWEIEKVPSSKYYSITQFSVLRQFAQISITTFDKGLGDDFKYEMLIALPLADTALLTGIPVSGTYNQLLPANVVPRFWLCMELRSERLKRNNTEAWKKEREAVFLKNALKNFYELDYAKIVYLNRVTMDVEDKVYYKMITSRYDMRTIGAPVILKPNYTPFEKRYLKMLTWAIVGFFAGMGILLLLMRSYSFDPARLQAFEDKKRVW